MLNNLSYRLKFIYLSIGFVLFLFLTFKLAINRTFEIKKQCKYYKEQLSKVENAPTQMALIKTKLDGINQRVGNKSLSQINFEELIIEHVSRYCKNHSLILKEYPGMHIFSQQDYCTETCKITVEGDFIKLLKLAYGIEHTFSYGKVSSLKFYTKKNIQTKNIELLLEIYVQNIKMQNHE